MTSSVEEGGTIMEIVGSLEDSVDWLVFVG